MTPTLDRIAINRANSQLSTGPRTVVGKENSRYNALRHGLTSQMVVMPTENLEVYQRHLKSFVDEYNPQGATEANLVQSLADTAWRLNRIISIEASLLNLAGVVQNDVPTSTIVAGLESQAKSLATLSLHSQRLSRQFERTIAQLHDLQQARLGKVLNKSKVKTSLPSEHGFVFSATPINQAAPAHHIAKAAASQTEPRL